MSIIIKYLCIMTISFAGVDRINLLSSNFEHFNFTPFLLFSVLLMIFILSFRLNNINFNWINDNFFSFQLFYIFIITILISAFLSQDMLVSFKRLSLLFLIFFSFILIISYLSKENLLEVLYKSSIIGSLIFFLFNVIISFLWFNYNSLTFEYINVEPNKIAYFIPRLGGGSLDVNRGGVVLLFYTYILLFLSPKKKFYVKVMILINIISIMFTLSRTVYILICFIVLILLYKKINYVNKGKIFKYFIFSYLIGVMILYYLDSIKLIELE